MQYFGRKSLLSCASLIESIKEAQERPPDEKSSSKYKQQLSDYKQLCEKMIDNEPKKVRALAVEILNDWDVIFIVFDHPHLPLTNNEAERALRHWVIMRRTTFGRRTREGAKVFAILASVIETCRLGQQSPWKYLAEVISIRRAGLPVPWLPLPI